MFLILAQSDPWAVDDLAARAVEALELLEVAANYIAWASWIGVWCLWFIFGWVIMGMMFSGRASNRRLFGLPGDRS